MDSSTVNYNEIELSSKKDTVSILMTIFLGIVTSCYFFPFSFTFLPESINTKILLAVLGIFILIHKLMTTRSFEFDKDLLAVAGIAAVYSVIGYISADLNNSIDFAYANYWVSFSTWILGAYGCIALLKTAHEYVDFKLLFNYLIAVCVMQCVIAIAMDNIPALKSFIDSYISQATVANTEFLNEVDRLYGIGAAIDVAGTRFSIVILGLTVLLRNEINNDNKIFLVYFYWISLIIILVIGNMISRTTIVGVVLGAAYLLLTTDLFRHGIKRDSIASWGNIVLLSVGLVLVTTYLYNTNDIFKDQFRFGFEGFFNWIEQGEWTTGSTDRLNSEMWIWPDLNDYKTWIIGKATFSNWHAVGTDIGYCRFIFYSGLLGLFTFSVFFVANALIFSRRFNNLNLFFILLLALGFIIWLKVSTDIFLIYALFYFLDDNKIRE